MKSPFVKRTKVVSRRRIHLALLVLGHILLLLAAVIHFICVMHNGHVDAGAKVAVNDDGISDAFLPASNLHSDANLKNAELPDRTIESSREMNRGLNRSLFGVVIIVAVFLDLVGYTLLSVESIGEIQSPKIDAEIIHDVVRRIDALERDDFNDICRLMDDGCPNVDPAPTEIIR